MLRKRKNQRNDQPSSSSGMHIFFLSLVSFSFSAKKDFIIEYRFYSRLMEGQYEILSATIGHGSYGYVHKAFDLARGTHVAVKRVVSGPEKPAENEICVLGKLNGLPNIITLIGSFHRGTVAYIVTELGTQDLGDFIQQQKGNLCSESQAKVLVKDMLVALQGIHAHGIVHRDIKPANWVFCHQPQCSGSNRQ